MKHRIAFTILGLTNNFSYNVMLAAAEDITSKLSTSSLKDGIEKKTYCNDLSTSTVLLADIGPSLLLQFMYPFLLVEVRPIYKVVAVVLLAIAGFLLTGLSNELVLVFAGVISASLSSGLGESTYLSDTSIFGIDSLAGWAMGTGAAGMCGSSAYAVLTTFLETQTIMLIMIVVPIVMMFVYVLFVAKDREKKLGQVRKLSHHSNGQTSIKCPERQTNIELSGGESMDDISDKSFGFKQRVMFMPKLANYFFPVVIVFFGGYFINQGLVEFIYFSDVSNLDKPAQYRWLQVAYHLGSFFARSSISLFRVKFIWMLAFLQVINVGLILGHVARVLWLPSYYLVAGLILYQGLITGFSYSNTYYRIGHEIEPSKQHFSISTVVVSDALGISLAAIAALPVHKSLCTIYD